MQYSTQPGDSTLAVGMISAGSGLLSFQHRAQPESTAQASSTRGGKRKVRNVRNAVPGALLNVKSGDKVKEV